MKKLDKNVTCPKCGFKPFTLKWKLEYTEKCLSTQCEWEDDIVEEHLHQICPDCSYVMVSPCLDYDEKASNQWSTKESIPTATEIKQPSVPQIYVPQNPKVTVISGGNSNTTKNSTWGPVCPGCKVGSTPATFGAYAPDGK